MHTHILRHHHIKVKMKDTFISEVNFFFHWIKIKTLKCRRRNKYKHIAFFVCFSFVFVFVWCKYLAHMSMKCPLDLSIFFLTKHLLLVQENIIFSLSPPAMSLVNEHLHQIWWILFSTNLKDTKRPVRKTDSFAYNFFNGYFWTEEWISLWTPLSPLKDFCKKNHLADVTKN